MYVESVATSRRSLRSRRIRCGGPTTATQRPAARESRLRLPLLEAYGAPQGEKSSTTGTVPSATKASAALHSPISHSPQTRRESSPRPRTAATEPPDLISQPGSSRSGGCGSPPRPPGGIGGGCGDLTWDNRGVVEGLGATARHYQKVDLSWSESEQLGPSWHPREDRSDAPDR